MVIELRVVQFWSEIILLSVQLPLFTNMPREINQLSVDVKVLAARCDSGEEAHNKMAATFSSSVQMETLKIGRLFASRLHDFKHEGLSKITTVE